jgi:hypothetical protein
VTLRPAEFDRHIAAFDETSFGEARAKGRDEIVSRLHEQSRLVS